MTEQLSFRTEMEFAYGVPRELAPGVVRLVANNPSVFTFKGTNTYIIGDQELAIIDPGPEDAAHREAILKAAGDRRVSHILITHTHRDHIDGLAALQAATGALTCGYGRTAENPAGAAQSPSGSEFIDNDFRPDVVLRDGDTVSSPGWSLTALFTPGHAPDHLCFALGGSKILFSGDHVMAWNTSVVAPPEGRMSDYMTSLSRLLDRDDTVYLPGHGGRVEEPRRTVRAYIVHRQWREQAIYGAIKDGHHSVPAVTALVYKGLDERLVKAASLSVLAHVEHLVERGLVRAETPLSLESRLSAA